MEADFWHQKWRDNELGFHLCETNPLLLAHFSALDLEKGRRIFLPLCGKTRDIHWLLAEGYQVVGAELSEFAVKQLFEELGLSPDVSELGKHKRFSAENIDIFVGDFFELNKHQVGSVDAVYDRAALVALPEPMRIRYTAHLIELTAGAEQLLFCFEYDQQQMDGPPFSVNIPEVKKHYAQQFDLTLITSVDLPEGLKGKCAATEHVWLLKQR